MEHEATVSKVSEDQLFYVMQRGLSQEEAVQLLVNGFVKDVLQELPMQEACLFAVPVVATTRDWTPKP